ncbi:MAG: sugar phosphate isomerase/epimerase family protein [Opitutales bacterium]
MSTFRPGLVSITFRKLSTDAIIELCQEAGLEGIEWGGDVHVPPGEGKTASEVGKATRDAGLNVAAYGSYYRAGPGLRDESKFDAVLESARMLGAPLIRVWAGPRQPVAEATEQDWKDAFEDAKRIAALAEPLGIQIAFEYHGGTLTEWPETASRLMSGCDHPNIDTLWQPINGAPLDTNLDALHRVGPRIANLHVFHWGDGSQDRYALAAGEERWKAYLEAVEQYPRDGRWALLEFVKEDDPRQCVEDAATLRSWLAGRA